MNAQAQVPDRKRALSLICSAFDIIDLAYHMADEPDRNDQVLRAMDSPAKLAWKAIKALDHPGETVPEEQKIAELKSLLEAMAYIGSHCDNAPQIDVLGLMILARRLCEELTDDLA